MAGTYGSGTYGGGDYGPNFGGTAELEIVAVVTTTAALQLGGGGALQVDAEVTTTATLFLGGGSETLVINAQVVATGTLELGGSIPLWFEAGTTSTHGSLDLPPKGTNRRFVVVDMDGTPLGELENAITGPITWALNKPVEWSCSLSADDPKAQLVHDERFREVQLWRGDHLLTWGPIVRPRQSIDRLDLTGRDCLWYLGRRHIGKAERTNYIANPSFEDGLAHWKIGQLNPFEGNEGRKAQYVLGSVSSTRAVHGRYSARIELPDDTYPKYGAGAQQVIFWEAESQAGDEWTISLWVHIPSATLRSLDGASLALERHSTTEFAQVFDEDGVDRGLLPVGIEASTVPITPDFPLDTWHQIQVALQQPPTGEVEQIGLVFYAPRAVTYIELGSLTYNERLEYFATDQATIAAQLVAHLQDPAFDKSDLNIATACPPTGVLRDATYLHEEHHNGLRSLEDFTKLDDGFDHRIEYTPTTRTYTIDYPASGRWRPKVPLQLNAELVDFDWTFDGELAASAVVTLGQGRGSGRTEGFAGDATAYANDLILEEVFAAPPGAPVASLDNLAAERLAVTTSPEVLEFTTAPDPALTTRILGSCRVGDVLPVVIQRGHLLIEGTRWRLVKLTLNPDDSLAGTLNRRDVTT